MRNLCFVKPYSFYVQNEFVASLYVFTSSSILRKTVVLLVYVGASGTGRASSTSEFTMCYQTSVERMRER